ncbi:hypothetical protein GCM10026983_41140 [Gracilibacillus alcaliphilus]
MIIKLSDLITSITILYTSDLIKYDFNFTSNGNKKIISALLINVRTFGCIKIKVINNDKITSTDI